MRATLDQTLPFDAHCNLKVRVPFASLARFDARIASMPPIGATAPGDYRLELNDIRLAK